MNINLIVIILIISIISSLLKKYAPEFFTLFNIISVFFILFLLLPSINDIITSLNSIFNLSKFLNSNHYIILKILGIYLITQFSSDICKDSGYESFSNAINIFGKINIIFASMQIFKDFFNFLSDILNKVSI